MRGFTKEEAKKHKESLKEMFEKVETEERLDRMCRMFNETYNEALEFKQQRDELLKILDKIVNDEHIVFEPALSQAKELINKIEGNDK